MPLLISQGGTNATTAAEARTNLGAEVAGTAGAAVAAHTPWATSGHTGAVHAVAAFDAAGNAASLAPGAAGQVLMMVAGIPTWSAVAALGAMATRWIPHAVTFGGAVVTQIGTLT